MAIYNYKALNNSGKIISDSLEADSEIAAVQRLHHEGLTVTEIKISRKKNLGGSEESFFASLFKKKVKLKDLAVFSKQLSFMLEAGVPLFSALQIIADNESTPGITKLLEGLMHELRSGKSFGDSCREFPEIPSLMADMISAGEVGGFLDTALARLSEHFEKELKTKEKVKTAMIYPIVIIAISLIAVSVVMLFVIPVFGSILDGMDVQLPLGTIIILKVSLGFKNYWYIVLGIIALLAFLLFMYLRSPQGKKKLDNLSLKVPIVSDLVRKVIVARFCRTLANLLRSGVPIVQSLGVVSRTLNNESLTAELESAEREVIDGNSLTQSFKNTKIFPPMVIQMIAVGEQSGNLDELLEKVSDYYDEEVDEATERLPKLIEPLMLLFLGIMVGGIVVGVLIPMFSVMTSIG